MHDAYSYRNDATVPSFPDDKPLFIFDGVCVLCSGGARWLMQRDAHNTFRFTSAQSPLGQALYKHYNIAWNDTYLLIDQGRAYGKSDGYLHMLDLLGGAWGLLKVLYLLPRGARDWQYDIVARHRYAWFGKTDYCRLIPQRFKNDML